MKKLLTLAFSAFIAITPMLAQKFYPPVNTYSHKKISYITLKDGRTVEGEIKDVDRKKGLIDLIKIKDATGSVMKFKPEAIKEMYLPSSGWDKMNNTIDFASDMQKWDNPDMNEDFIAKGYVFIEQSEVMIKKKKMTLLIQCLNPHFSGKIKVYHDPFGGETMGAGIGGITLVGGLDKTYYVKKAGDKVAVRLKKKNYDDVFQDFYSSCPEVAKLKPQWSDFEKHVYTFATECGK